MKFGKRSEGDDAGVTGEGVSDSSTSPPAPEAPEPPEPPLPPVPSEPPLPPVPESPPPVTEQEVPVAEQEAPGSPAGEELPVTHVEPVVEGEAYEVFSDEPPQPVTVHQHVPPPPPESAPMPFPVAEQPISVVTPGAGPAPVTTLGDSGEAFASGHAAGPGSSWQEPAREIAQERPELVVAAAFAGGVLAAMILRRLGN